MISSDEVIQAITALQGTRRLVRMASTMVFSRIFKRCLLQQRFIGNEVLVGGKPPPSFLQGLTIPLRKKSDFADAMDYRPIALFQTGYKVYAKVIASRVQRVLRTPIGESQQGFVHGRQMCKIVMMMLAQLTTANAELEIPAASSRAIL